MTPERGSHAEPDSSTKARQRVSLVDRRGFLDVVCAIGAAVGAAIGEVGHDPFVPAPPDIPVGNEEYRSSEMRRSEPSTTGRRACIGGAVGTIVAAATAEIVRRFGGSSRRRG